MTADEIIAEALIPDTHSVFVLGSFEQRVTVFAQQVRALNLVDAILSRGLLQDTGSVATVGGGAAGITAAVVTGTGKLIHVGTEELIHLNEGIMAALSGDGLVRGIHADQDIAQAGQEPSRHCL